MERLFDALKIVKTLHMLGRWTRYPLYVHIPPPITYSHRTEVWKRPGESAVVILLRLLCPVNVRGGV
jgi:hypothetical protein